MASVTIVVAPRERFSLAPRSLASILQNTERPFELVYVDGASPPDVAAYLAVQAQLEGFRLIRSERYLSPNAARNLGARDVTTDYVVFVDNDLLVSGGWLPALVRCAEETGAWAVGPLYLQGEPHDGIIHMAGGDIHISGRPGAHGFTSMHRLQGVPLREVATSLARGRCDFVEFHCMLVRRAALEQLGPFDEGLLSTREHLDFCMRVRAAGGEVHFEPAALVAYSHPPPLAWTDVPYFLLRWSEAWNGASFDRFCAKYGIDDEYKRRVRIMNARRQVVFAPLRRLTRRALGARGDRWFGEALFRAERVVNRLVVPRSARGVP